MIRTGIHGLCMALADSVPGVSGGTIAFILGFYDRLLDALHLLFGKEKKERKDAVTYLCKLGIGWLIGMISCMLVLSGLFEKNIYFMSSLFLGLTVMSVPFILIEEKEALCENRKNILLLLLGAGVVTALSLLRSSFKFFGALQFSALTPGQYLFLFVCGMIAISAMVLPGVSGSTVLLIAGIYLPLIEGVKELVHLNFSVLTGMLTLAAGILLGAFLSIRNIQKALHRHRSRMMYLILGLLLGSMAAIIMGPTTLSKGLAPLSIGTFQPFGFLLGIALLLLMEVLRNRHSV